MWLGLSHLGPGPGPTLLAGSIFLNPTSPLLTLGCSKPSATPVSNRDRAGDPTLGFWAWTLGLRRRRLLLNCWKQEELQSHQTLPGQRLQGRRGSRWVGWGKVPGMGLGSGCILTILEPEVILGPLGLTICRAQRGKVTGNPTTGAGGCEEGREGPKTEEVCMWERLLGQA